MRRPTSKPSPTSSCDVEANLVELFRYQGLSPEIELTERPGLTWLLSRSPAPFANLVCRAELEPREVDRRVEEVIDFFRNHGSPLRWIRGPNARPENLDEILESHGFLLVGESPGMVLELRDLDENTKSFPLVVKPVRDVETLELCKTPMQLGHSMAEPAAEFMLRTFASLGFDEDMPWRLYVGLHRGEPVAVAGSFLGATAFGIHSVATVPEVRGRGLGTAITLVALEDARRAGYRRAVLRSTTAAQNLYRRLGFRERSVFRDYVWTGE